MEQQLFSCAYFFECFVKKVVMGSIYNVWKNNKINWSYYFQIALKTKSAVAVKYVRQN